jgi:hypothetical protein
VFEPVFWYVHSITFFYTKTAHEQTYLLKRTSEQFVKYIQGLGQHHDGIFKHYHYFLAKATYEGLLLVFPRSRESLQNVQ